MLRRSKTSSESRTPSARRLFLSAGATLAGVVLLPSALTARADDASSRAGAVALAFDPTSQILYKASADELTRSTDGRHRWSGVRLPLSWAPRSIAAIAVPAGARPAIYVAGVGLSMLRSDDGECNWTRRSDGLPGTGVAALTAHACRHAVRRRRRGQSVQPSRRHRDRVASHRCVDSPSVSAGPVSPPRQPRRVRHRARQRPTLGSASKPASASTWRSHRVLSRAAWSLRAAALAAGAADQSLRVAGGHRAGHRRRHRAPARGAHRGTRHLTGPGALLPAARRGLLLCCRPFQPLESSGVLSNYQPLRL